MLRLQVFDETFSQYGARAFGISGDRTQHLLWRIQNGELQFRHAPEVVCICVGTNNSAFSCSTHIVFLLLSWLTRVFWSMRNRSRS